MNNLNNDVGSFQRAHCVVINNVVEGCGIIRLVFFFAFLFSFFFFYHAPNLLYLSIDAPLSERGQGDQNVETANFCFTAKSHSHCCWYCAISAIVFDDRTCLTLHRTIHQYRSLCWWCAVVALVLGRIQSSTLGSEHCTIDDACIDYNGVLSLMVKR